MPLRVKVAFNVLGQFNNKLSYVLSCWLRSQSNTTVISIFSKKILQIMPMSSAQPLSTLGYIYIGSVIVKVPLMVSVTVNVLGQFNSQLSYVLSCWPRSQSNTTFISIFSKKILQIMPMSSAQPLSTLGYIYIGSKKYLLRYQ